MVLLAVALVLSFGGQAFAQSESKAKTDASCASKAQTCSAKKPGEAGCSASKGDTGCPAKSGDHITCKMGLKPQTTCPVMGGKIKKDVYADVPGHRIYACCAGCISKIEKDPAKAIAALMAKGERPEMRIVVCAKCGEVKGVEKCCKADAAKCSECGLNKGAPGCCKDLKAAKGEKDIVLCPGCGEVKGGTKCCKADAEKCSKCALNKGAPGCCKDLGSACAGAKCSMAGSGAKNGCCASHKSCPGAKAGGSDAKSCPGAKAGGSDSKSEGSGAKKQKAGTKGHGSGSK